jgi:hypothetical protein
MNESKKLDEGNSRLTRRELLKAAGSAGLGLTAAGLAVPDADTHAAQQSHAKHPTMMGVKFEARDVVRLGIVGVGLRGTDVLGEFLAIDKVTINAVCDVVNEKCLRAAQLVEKAGQRRPAIYSNGERDFERLAARDDLDFIYIATPWEWHVPQVLAGLKEG